MSATPEITAVVCARTAGGRIAETVRSVLASDHSSFSVSVIDQTNDDRTRESLDCLLQDPRVQYIRCADPRIAAGQNAGARQTSSAWLAFTDDDCVVTPSWLAQITTPFALDARTGVVYGTVKPAPYDPASGFLPSLSRAQASTLRSVGALEWLNGMRASMAVRRSVWAELEGFDERLTTDMGVEPEEDVDFVVRALLAGYVIHQSADATVIHAGIRPWDDGPRAAHARLQALGIAWAKNLKRGHWRLLGVAHRLFLPSGSSGSPFNTAWNRHYRAGLAGLASGVRHGLATPVDRATGHFRTSTSRRADGTRGAAGAAGRSDEARLRRAVFPAVIEDRSPAQLDPGESAASTLDKVSIVMPNWNARPFLERALTSLVQKTTYPYELIVVDNGSTDGSKDFIRSFLRNHPELDATFIDHAENLYFSTACNRGFQAASSSSKYLALYCNDVEATHDSWLQELVHAVQPDDTIAAGHAAPEAVTDRHREVFLSYDPIYPDADVKRRLVELITKPGATYMHLYGYCFILKRALLHRTGLYLHTGPFTQYHSDWEWYLRFAVMGYRIAPVPIKVHHWYSVSELLAFHPDLYDDLLRRIDDPSTVERYLKDGRPFYEEESGFRSRFATPVARTIERLKRGMRGKDG